jgi:hypothetical protein
MFHILLLCTGLLAPLPDDDLLASTVKAEYQAVHSRIGTGSDAHVRLALWCEAHHMMAEKLKHLTIAILRDPAHEAARGLMGLVRDGDKWRRPEDVEARVRADQGSSAVWDAYDRMRTRAKNDAEDHWKLALWCEQNHMMAESRAHLTAVTRLDPSRAAAWKRLGFKSYDGRWMSEERIRNEQAERAAEEKANVRWLRLLSGWNEALNSKKDRDSAERSLAEVTDPRAVPAVWRVFVQGDGRDHARAVQLLGQIDAPSSTRALALLALFSPSADSRRIATETLSRRDPRDVAEFLVALLGDPEANKPNFASFYFRVGIKLMGEGEIGSPGVLVVESRWFDSLSLYTVDETRLIQRINGWVLGNVPGQLANYERRLVVQRQRQMNDLAAIVDRIDVEARREVFTYEASARHIRDSNFRITQILKVLTKQNLGENREAWRKWWNEEQGYAYELPRTPVRSADYLTDTPKPFYFQSYHFSCFGAGTPVRTRSGLRPIETLRVGDQVLTQDTKTGALAYEPIVSVSHNPPAETLRIITKDEVLVTTGIHRFWKGGGGWVMARALRSGDTLRTFDDLTRVQGVEVGSTQPVYNLEVLGNHCFFVGERGMLVHDKSQVNPVADPFDSFSTISDSR